MPDYSNGKIYLIKSSMTPKVYIGSTIEKLCVRMAKHRAAYKKFLRGTGLFVSSFEILQYPDAEIVLAHRCPCKNRKELGRAEGRLILNTNCVNRQVTGFGKEMASIYRARPENRERARKASQAWRDIEENRERARRRKSQKFDCPCGGRYRTDAKVRHTRTARHMRYTDGNAMRRLFECE